MIDQIEELYVQNILVTGLFLVLLLSTVSLVLFLLMRKPTCFACCRDSMHPTPTHAHAQQDFSTFLTDVQTGVLKQRLTDSPPPYESPPDYESLPPELLVTPGGLTEYEISAAETIPSVHGSERYHKPHFSTHKTRRALTTSVTSSKPKPVSRTVIGPPVSRTVIVPPVPLTLKDHSAPPCSNATRLSSCKTVPPPPAYECVVKDNKEPQRH